MFENLLMKKKLKYKSLLKKTLEKLHKVFLYYRFYDRTLEEISVSSLWAPAVVC